MTKLTNPLYEAPDKDKDAINFWIWVTFMLGVVFTGLICGIGRKMAKK